MRAHTHAWHLVEGRRLPRLRRAPAAALGAAAQPPVVAQEHGAAGPRRVVGELAGSQRGAARADGLYITQIAAGMTLFFSWSQTCRALHHKTHCLPRRCRQRRRLGMRFCCQPATA
jgi:hypothetical protein